jgi:hypothetical protein
MEGCLIFGLKGCLIFVAIVILAIVAAKVNNYFDGLFFRKLCSGMSGSYEVKDVKDLAYVHQFHTVIADRKVDISFGVPTNSIKVAFEHRLASVAPTDSVGRQQKLEILNLLEIRIPVMQKFWLRIQRELLPEEDIVEIHARIDWIDSEYVIQTTQRDAAESFLRKFPVQELLGKFPSRFDKLEILHGEIFLLLYHPQKWGLNQLLFNKMLHELISFAQLYEDHQRIDMQIEITTSSSRCPYCRTALDEASGEKIVQCPDCSTRLHEACWNENLQCTTWGCNSTATERNVQQE